MRKLVLQEFVSLDGLGSGPGGDLSFIPESLGGDEGIAEHQTRFLGGYRHDPARARDVRGLLGLLADAARRGRSARAVGQPDAEGRLLDDARARAVASFPEAAISRSAIDDIPPLKSSPART